MQKQVLSAIACFIILPLYGMYELQVPRLEVPSEIVISNELGIVECIPFGNPLEKEINQWVVRELIQHHKDLEERLKKAERKWYYGVAGIVTTVVPLVVCVIELVNATHDCK